jgi:hypothetical protein
MSSYSSQTPWASRRRAASVLLSSRNSAIMSSGSMYGASLSDMRCKRAMWPMDLSVVPPKLADPLRDGVGHGEKLVGLLIKQQIRAPCPHPNTRYCSRKLYGVHAAFGESIPWSVG